MTSTPSLFLILAILGFTLYAKRTGAGPVVLSGSGAFGDWRTDAPACAFCQFASGQSVTNRSASRRSFCSRSTWIRGRGIRGRTAESPSDSRRAQRRHFCRGKRGGRNQLFRADDGASQPKTTSIFASGLNLPSASRFGLQARRRNMCTSRIPTQWYAFHIRTGN